jgi:type III secretion protein S
MDPETVAKLSTEALMLVLQMSAPLVGVAAIIGLLFGFLQALTQLQDQTTTFAVKLVAVVALVTLDGGANQHLRRTHLRDDRQGQGLTPHPWHSTSPPSWPVTLPSS